MQDVPRMWRFTPPPPMSDGYKAWEQSTIKASGKQSLRVVLYTGAQRAENTPAQIITLTEIQTQFE